MTVAVCVACGTPKVGALAACPSCGLTPSTPPEQARALLLSDRFAGAAALDEAGARIRGGEPAAFDEVRVRDLAAVITAGPPTPTGPGLVMFVIGFVLAIGAIGFLILLVIRWAVLQVL